MTLPKGLAKYSQDVLKTPFVMLQAHPDDYHQFSQKTGKCAEQGILLSKIFFHHKNVDLIQKWIIMEVFYRSNGEYLIERQNQADLQIVMHYIFLQYSRNLPCNIREQVKRLDDLVVNEVVPEILSQIRAHAGYLERTFGQREIMDLPQNVSTKGAKTLPSVSTRF